MGRAIDMYVEGLEKKTSAFKDKLRAYVEVLGSSDQDSRKHAINFLRGTLVSLNNHVGDVSQKPEWMKELLALVSRYVDSSYSDKLAKPLSEFLALNFRCIIEHQWTEALADDQTVDIAGAFNSQYKSKNVEFKFDTLIEQLQSIIDREAIDSNKAINSLKSLIALIRKNKGNAFSAKAIVIPIWNLCVNFLEDLERHEDANPYLKSIVPAIRQTIEDIDTQTTRVFDEGGKSINKALSGSIKVIEHKDSLRIESNVISRPADPANSVIDVEFTEIVSESHEQD